MRATTLLTTLLIPLLSLPISLTTVPPSATYPILTSWEQIHQTIHLYPLSIDQKNFALFPSIFAPNAFANYTGFLSNLTGLAAITAGLEASVAGIDTQHLLGTTYIDIAVGGEQASATTYVQASLFGRNGTQLEGAVLYLYAYYADELQKFASSSQQYPTWLITKRLLVFLGPGMVGNLSVIGE